MTSAPLPTAKPQLSQPGFLTVRTITALMLREMTATYGRSPGGYVWAVLQPIGMIVILSVGFSLLMRSPSLGTSFMLFYATGFLPFSISSTMADMVRTAIFYSRALLAYPRVTWLDAVLARFILNFITLSAVFCIVITGILMVVDTRTVIDIAPILGALTLAAFVGLGVGVMNCVLTGLFPVWQIFWSIISRPMFIASGVIFIYEDLPPVAQNVLWWNPLMHVTGLARTGFFPTYYATYVSVPYVVGVSLVLLAAGLVFLRGHYKTILELG